MKLPLLLIILATTSFTAFSQINQSQWLVGGAAVFKTSKNMEDGYGTKSAVFQTSPNVGYFFFNKLAAGARIGFIAASGKSNYPFYGGAKDNSSKINLSPFARFYFLSRQNKLNLFLDGSYDLGFSRERYKLDGQPLQTSKHNTKGYTVSGGPVIFINRDIAVELTLSYVSSKQDSYPSEGMFMSGVGFQLHLGGRKQGK